MTAMPMPAAKPALFPAHLLTNHLALAAMLWAGMLVISAGISWAIDYWGDLNASAWEDLTQAPRWYVLFIGVHLGNTILPFNLAHGQTRREFVSQAAWFAAVFALVIGLLVTIGFPLELALYKAFDWEHAIEGSQIYDSVSAVHLIFAQQSITLVAWFVAGLFIAAAWYRDGESGWFAIIPAAIALVMVETLGGAQGGPIGWLSDLLDYGAVDHLLRFGIALAGLAALTAMAWAVIRDIPLRTSPS